jgi:hypothetical protein
VQAADEKHIPKHVKWSGLEISTKTPHVRAYLHFPKLHLANVMCETRNFSSSEPCLPGEHLLPAQNKKPVMYARCFRLRWLSNIFEPVHILTSFSAQDQRKTKQCDVRKKLIACFDDFGARSSGIKASSIRTHGWLNDNMAMSARGVSKTISPREESLCKMSTWQVRSVYAYLATISPPESQLPSFR